MRNVFHYLDFVEYAFFAFDLRLQILFRECLNGEFLVCFFVLDQVNSGERPLAYHFDGVVLLMKVRLDENLGEGLLPVLQIILSYYYELTVLQIFDESERTNRLSSLLFLLHVLNSDLLSLHQASDFGFGGGLKVKQVVFG